MAPGTSDRFECEREFNDMAQTSDSSSRSGPSDYLAAERTFLAWIRTGIALMGFGFVVARFGLFLRELETAPRHLPGQSPSVSLWFGTALIVIGVCVNLLSSWRHTRLVRALRHGTAFEGRASPAIAVALILAGIGFALAIYLILVQVSGESNSGKNQEAPMVSVSMKASSDNGIVSKPSNHSVDATVEKLKAILQAKGVMLFALVDHSGEAEKAGMKMRPTKLLIFGNPKAGTPLMLAAPTMAIDLPLKLLVAEDADGKVWLSYNSPEYLRQRHNLPAELVQNIAVVETLAAKVGE